MTIEQMTLDEKIQSIHGWQLVPGEYKMLVGGSSLNNPQTCDLRMPG
jgi:hypothetical protein